jgi:hypothetical protein
MEAAQSAEYKRHQSPPGRAEVSAPMRTKKKLSKTKSYAECGGEPERRTRETRSE